MEKERKLNPIAELAAYKIGVIESEETSLLNDRYVRLAAEFDNFRKRTSRQYEDVIRNANSEIILEWLSVIDDFQRALEMASKIENQKTKDEAGFIDGMRLIYDKMLAILKDKGVEPMESLAKQFDPNLHEAVMQMPSDEPEGTIIGVVSPGYKLKDKVIRHAKVIVASPK